MLKQPIGYAAGLEATTSALKAAIGKTLDDLGRKAPRASPSPHRNPVAAQKTPPRLSHPAAERRAADTGLTRPEQRIVDSLAFWLGIGKTTRHASRLLPSLAIHHGAADTVISFQE